MRKETKMNILPIDELREKLRDPKKRPSCPECEHHKATDVHHIDSNHSNNAPSNLVPWCKRCHNEHHGISDNLTIITVYTRQYYAVQKQRMAMANRIRAYKELGYAVEDTAFKQLEGVEKELLKQVASLLKTEPVYQYLKRIKGCGPAIAASLVSDIGDPGRFATVSKLWAYAGLDVKDGKARRKAKGAKAAWNHELRKTLAGKLTDQFVRLKHNPDCLGYRLYEQYKAFYVERDGGTLRPIHIERRARRKVAKVFLSCLWVAWRKIKGLPVSEPYAFDRLEGHTSIITPEMWAGDDWMENIQLNLELAPSRP
jgi:hypothetical protein